MFDGASLESSLAALIAADTVEQRRILLGLDASLLSDIVTSLGRSDSVEAAGALATLEETIPDRSVRKSARRELHRLRSRGIRPPEIRSVEIVLPRTELPEVVQSEVRASAIDVSGSRAVLFWCERRTGGSWLATAIFDESIGLAGMDLVPTARKRFQRILDQTRPLNEPDWTTLPLSYGLELVQEAVATTRAAHLSLPPDYAEFCKLFGQADSPPERALVYETISPVAATFNPEWLHDSGMLLEEPELLGWLISIPPDFKYRTLELARSTTSRLLIPGATSHDQALRLVRDVAHATLAAPARQLWKRRLEETAYLFLRSGRNRVAEMAVATAVALGDSALPPEGIPFVSVLLAYSLGSLVGDEAVTGTPAAELVWRAIEEVSEELALDAPGTTASGLILPR